MLGRTNLSVDDRITRARIQMYKRSPFFAYILLHMKMIEAEENSGVPSMGVNHKGEMRWNRKWCEKLSEEEMMGVIGHEVMHIALMHLTRAKRRDPHVFNVANDLVVNSVLIEDGFTLPSEGLKPDHNSSFEIFKYQVKDINKKSSEEIYDEIYHLCPKIKQAMISLGQCDDSDKSQGGLGGGSGDQLSKEELEEAKRKLNGFDKHEYGSGKDKAEQDESDKAKGGINKQQNINDKWKRVVANATQLAKQQGKLPAGLERMIEDVLDSKVDWRHRLYKYIVDQIIHDYSWNMPSKRSAACGVYLPRPVKESVKIVVSFDTSGSIGRDELEQFAGELLAIGESFPNINVDVIICDAQVHETYELTKETIDDIKSMKMSGGGGTSHLPIYEYIEENIEDCQVLINFTDGFTDFPEYPEEIPFDTLWVIDRNGCDPKHIPFGDVIKIE